MRSPLFRDRTDAGRLLGAAVPDSLARPDVVLGLARGGVPVAAEVAAAWGAPLDVVVVRKLGVPGHRELAMGAVASGGVRVINDRIVERLAVSPHQFDEVAAAEQVELERRERAYRGDRQPLDLAGRSVVLVDDGLATGATVLAAVLAVREAGVRRVVVVAPVGSLEACRRVGEVADDALCLHTPEPFYAVGDHYADFRQTTDDEVRRLLA